MLTYFTTGSNNWTIRTQPIASSTDFIKLELQDMFLLSNQSQSISPLDYSYNSYESLLTFQPQISGAIEAAEYRATIKSGSTEIWHGSVQVFGTASILSSSKADYTNQNTEQYISHLSDNEYIILE